MNFPIKCPRPDKPSRCPHEYRGCHEHVLKCWAAAPYKTTILVRAPMSVTRGCKVASIYLEKEGATAGGDPHIKRWALAHREELIKLCTPYYMAKKLIG